MGKSLRVPVGGIERLMAEVRDQVVRVGGMRDGLRSGQRARFAPVPHHCAEKPQIGGRQRTAIDRDVRGVPAAVRVDDADDVKLGRRGYLKRNPDKSFSKQEGVRLTLASDS